MTALLFVGGPDEYSHRLIRETWDSGHFFLFALVFFLLLTYSSLSQKSILTKFIFATIIGLMLASMTELLQAFVGRNPQVIDIIKDLLGSYAGLLASLLYFNKNLLTRIIIIAAIVILATIATFKLWLTIVDEWRLKSDFPMLNSFESSLELYRWRSRRAHFSQSKEKSRHGGQSLKATLFSGKYPGLNLHHFARDWSAYKNLNLSIYNTQSKPLKLTLKICDKSNAMHGYQYNDRYNKQMILYPGWNDLSFSLEEIKNAPQTRQMNMRSILSVSLFIIDLQKTVTIYLDNIYLAN